MSEDSHIEDLGCDLQRCSSSTPDGMGFSASRSRPPERVWLRAGNWHQNVLDSSDIEYVRSDLTRKPSPSKRRAGSGKRTLPCPFCGKAPVIDYWAGGSPDRRMISCQSKDCLINPFVIGDSLEETLSIWNKRSAN